MVCILCSDGGCVSLDTKSLRNCPPVLARFLGMVDGFAAPNVDEFDRLTFVDNYQIPRARFVECITFLQSGHVRCLSELMETFNTLGGCAALDEFYENKLLEAAQKLSVNQSMRLLRLDNPLSPSENKLGLFRFEAHGHSWPHDDTWEVVGVLPQPAGLFWWRQKISNLQQS